jgi:hypothetical protein
MLESHVTAELPSLVEVCGAAVELVHTTVMPTLIVIDAGEKAKPLAREPVIFTFAWVPVGVGVLVELGGVVAVGSVAPVVLFPELPPHAARIRLSTSSPTVSREALRRVRVMRARMTLLVLLSSDVLSASFPLVYGPGCVQRLGIIVSQPVN